MLYVILLFIIWNWGITPLWVNIAVTIMCAIGIIFLGLEKEDSR